MDYSKVPKGNQAILLVFISGPNKKDRPNDFGYSQFPTAARPKRNGVVFLPHASDLGAARQPRVADIVGGGYLFASFQRLRSGPAAARDCPDCFGFRADL